MKRAPTPERTSERIDDRQQTVTRLLDELRGGNRDALNDLLPLVYDELHRLAHGQKRRVGEVETLNSTALVHEAYLRLIEQSTPRWSSRSHFLAVASTAMRQILLDYAKRKRATKRDGGRPPVPLHEVEASLMAGGDPSETGPETIVALNDALSRLEKHDARLGRIVECRFFGGMSIEETAEALEISPATVKRGWAMAQAWLYRDLRQMHGAHE